MTRALSCETPFAELSVSRDLCEFANRYAFENIKEMLGCSFNDLHQLPGFDYRLQREIVSLLQQHHWEDLLTPE